MSRTYLEKLNKNNNIRNNYFILNALFIEVIVITQIVHSQEHSTEWQQSS